jgi:hypothetical protein
VTALAYVLLALNYRPKRIIDALTVAAGSMKAIVAVLLVTTGTDVRVAPITSTRSIRLSAEAVIVAVVSPEIKGISWISIFTSPIERFPAEPSWVTTVGVDAADISYS